MLNTPPLPKSEVKVANPKPKKTRKSGASGAAEFHHRALSEPDVSLSAHPAPGIRLLA
jgi:hypothetical protein